jgi:hypothetical protein
VQIGCVRGCKSRRNTGFRAKGRGFESISLQRGVGCEPDFLDQGTENLAGSIIALERNGLQMRSSSDDFFTLSGPQIALGDVMMGFALREMRNRGWSKVAVWR